jgi:AcrR family transcriptional regulator
MVTRAQIHARMSATERREQLLDTTKALVDRRGFHAVSIEAVAREAGITRPVVYGHFGDLAGLLEALVEREAARAKAQLARVLPADLSEGDPRERLYGALRGYLQAVEADPATWRLVLVTPDGSPDILREQIAQGRAEAIAQLAGAVAPAFGGGAGNESPDPELTARTLSTLADEAARLLLADPDGYPVERILGHARWFLSRLLLA